MQDERRGSGGTSPRRPHSNGSNGARPEGLRTRSIPFADAADEPVDLVAVQADDELINALAAGMSVSAPGYGGYDADDHVAALLAAWRADVEADPVPDLVELDAAVATVLAASRPPARRARHLVPLAAAAAMVVFTIGGVSIGAHDARPGDTLWDVSRVLYSERAQSVEAAGRVEVIIAEAKEALVRGEPEVAAQVLAAADDDLLVVRPEEGQAELAEVQDFLEAKAEETEPGTMADLDSPLESDPTRPVPPGVGDEDPDPADEGDPDPSDAGSPDPGEPTFPESTTDPRTPTDPSLDTTGDPGTDADPGAEDPAEGEGGPDDPSVTPPTGTTEGGPDVTSEPGQGMGSSTGNAGFTADDGMPAASDTPGAPGATESPPT